MERIKNLSLNVLAPSAVLLAGVFATCLLRDRDESVQPVAANTVVRSVGVVAPLRYHGPITMNAHGVAVPHREVVLTAQVGGKVLSIADSLQTGRVVKAGERLVDIDDRHMQIEVQLIEAELISDHIDQEEAEKQLALLNEQIALSIEQTALMRRDFHRVKRTAQSFAASESQVDAAQDKWLQSKQVAMKLKSEANASQAKIHRSKVQQSCKRLELDKLKLEIERTKICAPIDGLVVRSHVEKGSTLSSGDRIATIQDTQAIEVSCSLVPNQLHRILGGSPSDRPATIRNASDVDYRLPRLKAVISHRHGNATHRWKATLSRSDGKGFDEQTRTLPCRLVIRQPKSDSGVLLRRGMFVNVELELPETQPMIAIPADAIHAGDEVWLLQGGQLKATHVRVAARQDDFAIVYGDPTRLSEDSRIVVSELEYAQAGKRIDTCELVAWNPILPTRKPTPIHSQPKIPDPTTPTSLAILSLRGPTSQDAAQTQQTAWAIDVVAKDQRP